MLFSVDKSPYLACLGTNQWGFNVRLTICWNVCCMASLLYFPLVGITLGKHIIKSCYLGFQKALSSVFSLYNKPSVSLIRKRIRQDYSQYIHKYEQYHFKPSYTCMWNLFQRYITILWKFLQIYERKWFECLMS